MTILAIDGPEDSPGRGNVQAGAGEGIIVSISPIPYAERQAHLPRRAGRLRLRSDRLGGIVCIAVAAGALFLRRPRPSRGPLPPGNLPGMAESSGCAHRAPG